MPEQHLDKGTIDHFMPRRRVWKYGAKTGGPQPQHRTEIFAQKDESLGMRVAA
jgi:hypothetical protein